MAPDPLLLAAGHEWDPGSALWHSDGEWPVWNPLWGLQMLRMLWGEQLMIDSPLFLWVLVTYIHASS